METLDDLEERFGEEFPSAVADPWRRDLERERYAAGADAGGELAERVERAAGEDRGRAGRDRRWPLGEDSFDAARAGRPHRLRRGPRGARPGAEEARAEAVHEWRKRAKDLWYQLRLLGELWPEVLGETADQAHALTDLLGDHHDLAVLAADLEARDTLDPEAILELIYRRQDELLERAIGFGERLYAEKPKAFGKRLRRYWKIARG